MTSTTPTVSERALRMLELIAKADEPPTLNELMAQLDLAKATTHRFASLLERASASSSAPRTVSATPSGSGWPRSDCT
jgi:DNA-binding IclR family transcriptional regulator